MLVAPGLTVYYFFIWRYWILGTSDELPYRVGPAGAKWVYWSWFILSAVSINLQRYGLIGVEGGILMDPRWGAKNGMQLMMHCDKNWGGPSGWAKVIAKCFQKPFYLQPSLGWILLAVASVGGFIIVPISGLTMELADGWTAGSQPIKVVGRGPDDFNYRTSYYEMGGDAYSRWKSATQATLPRRSAFYVPSTTSAANKRWLATFPNRWPDDSFIDLFITYQADEPVTGPSWGLRANYNCSIVRNFSDFEMLSQRDPKTNAPLFAYQGFGKPTTTYPGIKGKFGVGLVEPDADFYTYIVNQTTVFLYNLEGILEIATTKRSLSNTSDQCKPDTCESSQYSLFLQKHLSDSEPLTYEFALWESMRYLHEGYPEFSEALNDTLNDGVVEHFYDYLERPHKILVKRTEPKVIGVTCSAFMRVGTAVVNGLTGTFDNFEREDFVHVSDAQSPNSFLRAIPDILCGEIPGAPGMDTVDNLTSEYAIDNYPNPDWVDNPLWLYALARSAEARNRTFPYVDGLGQGSYLTADQLQLAVVRAFKAYSLSLMQNPEGVEEFRNLTVAVPVKVLVTGWLPPASLAILMSIWSAVSLWMAVKFAFRLRWADELDGYGMFRFGTDYGRIAATVSLGGYEHCDELLRVPGLIGDAMPSRDPGRISLVRESGGASTRKKYV